MSFLFKLIIHFYRFCLSPLLGGQCRFYPSCSQYALDAFEEYSWFRAVFLTLQRLGKCHPWHEGGVDPVSRDGRQEFKGI